jgi:hypothetical protein
MIEVGPTSLTSLSIQTPDSLQKVQGKSSEATIGVASKMKFRDGGNKRFKGITHEGLQWRL